jgi:hypothetical protein
MLWISVRMYYKADKIEGNIFSEHKVIPILKMNSEFCNLIQVCFNKTILRISLQ